MGKPYEIIAAPFAIYLAPVGEAFPDVDEDPAGNWALLGTSGSRDYNEEGITVSHAQEINKWRGLGGTGPRKAMRDNEDLMVRFTLHDMKLEQYATAINGVAVVTTAAGSGTPGTKSIQLYRGFDVTLYALLARGAGPEGANWSRQYQIPVVFQSGTPEPVYRKAEPAGLALEFTALEDPDAATPGERFGLLLDQSADALP